jgi:hypothetical protein
MQDFRKQEDERSREHWAFVESVANKVRNWPMWKQAATRTASQLTVVSNGVKADRWQAYIRKECESNGGKL